MKKTMFPRKFVEWTIINVGFTLIGYQLIDADLTFKTLDELYLYWLTEIKTKEDEIRS